MDFLCFPEPISFFFFIERSSKRNAKLIAEFNNFPFSYSRLNRISRAPNHRVIIAPCNSVCTHGVMKRSGAIHKVGMEVLVTFRIRRKMVGLSVRRNNILQSNGFYEQLPAVPRLFNLPQRAYEYKYEGGGDLCGRENGR